MIPYDNKDKTKSFAYSSEIIGQVQILFSSHSEIGC